MSVKRFAGLFLVLGLCVPSAKAQIAPRIKAKVVAFDGNILTVLPEGDSQNMKIGVRAATRILKEETRKLSDIQAGDFVGATLAKGPQDIFNAQEVHIFPAALKGSGEGLYPATPGSSHFIVNGTVSAASGSSLTVKFRGANGEGAGCIGRASLNPLVGCQGSATVTVAADAPVLTLAPGDKSLLVPGAVLAVSLLAGPDGKPVTPGITVETVATPPVPLPPAPSVGTSSQSEDTTTSKSTRKP